MKRHVLTRLLVALSVVVAAAIGTTVWAVTRSSQPASPLDALTAPACPGSSADRCTAPGTVRWILPLPGTYSLDGSVGTVDAQASQTVLEQMERQAGEGTLFPAAASAARLLVYQQGGLVEAIDPLTGKVRWRTELRRGGTLLDVIGDPPVVSGNVVVVVAMQAGTSKARAWELNAASGAVKADIPLGGTPTVITAAAGGVVIGDTSPVSSTEYQIEDLATANGSPLWVADFTVPKTLAYAPALIGHVLYEPSVAGDSIQRIDLDAGRALPPLPLPAGLKGARVYAAPFDNDEQTSQTAPVLVASTSSALARIDPATGQAMWTVHGNLSDSLLQVDPVSSPPAAEYVAQHSGNGRFQLVAVNLASGQTLWTAALSDSQLNDYLGSPFLPGQNLDDLMYNSQIVTYTAQSAQGLTRLEGLDPRTGRARWVGPWMSANLEILGWTTTGPPQIIAEACAPGGMRVQDSNGNSLSGGGPPDGTCTEARIFAVNA